MSNAKKNTLRKLSFLGFGKRSNNATQDGTSNDGEVQLDEEITKVFTMDSDPADTFDVNYLQDTPESTYPKQFGEKDYIQHRHMHVPHKGASKSMRRRASYQTPSQTGAETPSSAELPLLSTLPLSVQEPENLSSQTLHEESDLEAGNSSESEYVLSDPSSYRSPTDLSPDTPDKKVQFEGKEDEEEDGGHHKNKKKRSRHHHTLHSKFRKYSLQDDPSYKKRLEKPDGFGHNKQRRISTQPEDLPLKAADRDQLDSHRSDDARALRRHKTSRPSVVHIARKENGGDQLPSGFLKKMYDHSPHAIFVELDELHTEPDEREWKETARWIKYEEDVEEGVDRWGKPHVASLSFHSLLNLRKCLEDGLVCLDLEEKDLPAIAYRITEDLYREDLIREEDKAKIMRILLLRHRHVNEYHDRGFRFTKKHSYTSLQNLHDSEKRKISFSAAPPMKNGVRTDSDGKVALHDSQTIVDMKEETYSASNEDIRRGHNDTIFKRIPADAQGSSILVGEVDFLEQPAIAFIRLAEGVLIPSLIEVNIPVRFIFLLLGPPKVSLDYHEVGRSISTLMANQQFLNIAYKADNRKALLSAINEFLDDSIVLPPGDWERQALLPIEEIKAKSEAIRKRKENALALKRAAQIGVTKAVLAGEGDDEKKPPYPNPLERTKRPWGGLINDLKRRYPYYKSDIIDGLNAQCAAASIFMYFAAVSGAIAFGGLMGNKTNNNIGISETLVATSVSGVIFSLFAGQPIIITGNTGPLLLFDESLYQFCTTNGIEFLTTRVYIGLWLAVIALVVACLEGSVFVKLFSRFTEDIFSALIVLLYIVESFEKVFYIFGRHPLLWDYCFTNTTNESMSENSTFEEIKQTEDQFGPINQPNTALFCTILCLGTFTIAYYLKMFRNSQFLGRSARRALGDFGVPIAIIIMVSVDYVVPQARTEKLNVPAGLSPSKPEERGWFISPAGAHNPVPTWIVFASIVPALLVYILLFMETHICELIMDKKERKLKKGGGIHLDIVIVCCINVIMGFFGLPWVCAATVRSIAHISALTVMSRTHAPGEKPHLIEVKEQRMSNLSVSLLVGLSVLMAPLLQQVPMAVLFGFFLYLGIASIDGIQFFDRIKLLFMPVKHHPQAGYVRRVRTAKMHLYTFIQLGCLVVLWIVKSTKASLAFPFFLLLMIPVRAHLTCLFSPRELRALDGDEPDIDDDEPDFYAEAPLPG